MQQLTLKIFFSAGDNAVSRPLTLSSPLKQPTHHEQLGVNYSHIG
jgi:hypothetical protein